MQVTVYTPTTKLFEKLEALSVYLPSAHGDMEILENHVPILSSLHNGTVKISQKNGKKIEFDIKLGYVQYANNEMIIVAEQTSVTTEEIKSIQKKAESLKDKSFAKDDITEREFENKEDSSRV